MKINQYKIITKLTHCVLLTPYGDIDLGQHWLTQCFVPDSTKPLSELVSTPDYWHPSQCIFRENVIFMHLPGNNELRRLVLCWWKTNIRQNILKRMLNILCFFQPIITQELISTHPFHMTQKPFDQPLQIQASLDNENDDMLLPSVQCNVWYTCVLMA